MSYKKYICHYSSIQKPFGPHSVPDDFICTSDANFVEHFDLKKIGMHHIVLPSSHRSSLPHAESHEEEFVYVISGHPDVWINGVLYRLRPGGAVGFPAGTGICHSFLNNSKSDVTLLVLGERTKSENQFIYPLNLDLAESVGLSWWSDWPQQSLGSENCIPGSGHALSRPYPESRAIVDAPSIARQATFSYPGDSEKETVGAGVRLTDLLGMKALGVWHEQLMPGKRSSWPHAHKHEEELAYILSGQAKIWLNGYLYEAKAGDAIYFPPGTNIAHTIINDSTDPVEYIGIGQANAGESVEQVIYPHHPARNDDCRLAGIYWHDAPTVGQFGPHDGRPLKS